LKGIPKLQGLKPLLHRQLLHAFQLGFTHPRSGEAVAWEAPLPGDFQAVVDYLTST
jgi:23S rRNA pseudouridine1911/1915/1917 synthase